MACRRFITNYCVSGNLKAVRSLPTLAARNYSTDRDEISKPTHTGQVKKNNYCDSDVLLINSQEKYRVFIEKPRSCKKMCQN